MSIEKKRKQLAEDYKYILDNYGNGDNVDAYETAWDAIRRPESDWREKVNDAIFNAIETALKFGICEAGDGYTPLPVDDDKRLQQIKRRWKIE